MSDRPKFVVTYGRTVQTRPYETLKIQLLIEYHQDECSFDVAFREVRDKVEQWIQSSSTKADGK